MVDSNIFSAGTTVGPVPEGDASRQAVASLRGYAYQALASALAWIDLCERDALYLEVAEDYAVVARDVLKAVQVKDSQASGSVTLANENAKEALAGFVDLVERNPDRTVHLRFLTTASVGTERAVADRPAGSPGLEYWRKVASGMEEVGPLRAVLMSAAGSIARLAFGGARRLRHGWKREIRRWRIFVERGYRVAYVRAALLFVDCSSRCRTIETSRQFSCPVSYCLWAFPPWLCSTDSPTK